MEVLSAITQKIVADYISEDPLTHNKTYGTILNPHVKRRTGARPPPAPLAVKQETKTLFAKTKDPKAASASTSIETSKTLNKPKEAAPGSGELATKVGAPAMIKRESSDLFKSFAKAKPPKAKPSSAPVTSKDTPMQDAPSSDEDEDGAATATEDPAAAVERRKAREARAADLRRLAESTDEEEGAMKTKAASEPESEPEPESMDIESEAGEAGEAEAGDRPSAPIDAMDTAPDAVKDDTAEGDDAQAVVVSDGRRRGRRKVMKKKMTKDAEGYLVTKEELVWESFSEDDAPPPVTAKTKTTSSAAAATGNAFGAKGKKTAAGKPGQGKIMSFFGKK